MPPYLEITDYLESNYNPMLPWRKQWNLIQDMAWMIEDPVAYSTNRNGLGNAIKEGIHKAYLYHNLTIPKSSRMSAIKENAIRDIESFRTKPEYWANIK